MASSPFVGIIPICLREAWAIDAADYGESAAINDFILNVGPLITELMSHQCVPVHVYFKILAPRVSAFREYAHAITASFKFSGSAIQQHWIQSKANSPRHWVPKRGVVEPTGPEKAILWFHQQPGHWDPRCSALFACMNGSLHHLLEGLRTAQGTNFMQDSPHLARSPSTPGKKLKCWYK
ncbi:hypothetical protein JB92DRAFT_2825456 [Gautieria morchelliformis]|nr:hypothetical protein JB92DRAFT_2825456 [Gautieria morchelliformis]